MEMTPKGERLKLDKDTPKEALEGYLRIRVEAPAVNKI